MPRTPDAVDTLEAQRNGDTGELDTVPTPVPVPDTSIIINATHAQTADGRYCISAQTVDGSVLLTAEQAHQLVRSQAALKAAACAVDNIRRTAGYTT